MEKIIFDDLKEVARRAFYWQSFDPEGRGERTIKDYENELNEDLSLFAEIAVNNGKTELLPAINDRYISNYRRYLVAWLGSEGNCASSAVTGPAKFPVAKMQKRRGWADGHYNTFRTWRQRASKAIEKGLKKEITPAGELAAAEQKLTSWLERQAMMKAANKEIRKYKDVKSCPPPLVEALKALGVSETEVYKILRGDYMGIVGFASWELSNLNANIKRLRDRITYLSEKAAARESGGRIQEYEGFQVVENREIDRVQFIFPSAPSEEIRVLLRKKAFIYSPRYKANQRKLTPAAIYDAGQLAIKIQSLIISQGQPFAA